MTWRKCTEKYFTTPNTELLPDSVEEKRLLQKSSKHINDKPPCCASILETMARTVQMLVVRWVITHIGGSCPGEAFGMSWTKTSVCVCVLVCGRNTHWGLSWLCLWLLIGGSAALVLNSSPFLRVSLICSVSDNTQTKISMKIETLCTDWLSVLDSFHSFRTLRTFVWEPPWLWSYADGSAVLLVLWRSTQIVPHTLGADPTQVRALCLDALVHSLLLRWARNIRNH